MSVKVTVKDAAKKKHEVELLSVADDDDAAEQAMSNLRAWAEHGTTKIKEPLEVVSVKEVEDE